jgi:hypothetical protein
LWCCPTACPPPRIFTLVMANRVRFLRHCGIRLLICLNDLLFAHSLARGAQSAAQQTIAILGWFGWLIHPTKRTGTHVASQAFTALGVWVNLARQTFGIPPDKLARILAAQATGPPGRANSCTCAGSRPGQGPPVLHVALHWDGHQVADQGLGRRYRVQGQDRAGQPPERLLARGGHPPRGVPHQARLVAPQPRQGERERHPPPGPGRSL